MTKEKIRGDALLLFITRPLSYHGTKKTGMLSPCSAIAKIMFKGTLHYNANASLIRSLFRLIVEMRGNIKSSKRDIIVKLNAKKKLVGHCM
jgi:hypothetical protein